MASAVPVPSAAAAAAGDATPCWWQEGRVGLRFATANPKQGGSKAYERFEQYKHAGSVAEARRLGATTEDLKNDVAKGHAHFLDGTGSGDATAPDGSKRPTAERSPPAEPLAKKVARLQERMVTPSRSASAAGGSSSILLDGASPLLQPDLARPPAAEPLTLDALAALLDSKLAPLDRGRRGHPERPGPVQT